MSIVNYANKNYNIINDIQRNDTYFNYSICQNIETEEYVVVEKIDKEKLRNELSKLILIEDLNRVYKEYLYAYKKDIQLLKESVCQNLLQGIDFIDEEGQIIVIKEYADMNLNDYITKEKGHGITPKEIRYIFNQLNNALQIFKNKKNIHTCLCSENIFIKFKDHGLVTDDYTVKMADFGSLSKLEVLSKFQLNIKRKIPFMAPELFTPGEELKISDKADLWSLGILLYFLRFSELPFDNELYKTYKILPDPQDPKLKDLINKLLVIEPNKRMSWDEYFSHKFFEVPDNEKKELKIKRLRKREQTIRKDIIGIVKKGKNGKMMVSYDNGDQYEGDFVENVKEGKGVYNYSNGDKYEGDFFDDVKEGSGVYSYKNGERYEGEFKNGFADGRGAYYYEDGEKYVGDYKDDKRNGHGIYFYSNGDKYIGEFLNGKKHGKGILYDKYGNKKKDLYFENGEKIKKEKDILTPKNNKDIKFKGKGVKIYKGEDGGKYEGDFFDDVKEGYGVYSYKNGERYEGEFKNDKKDGHGI